VISYVLRSPALHRRATANLGITNAIVGWSTGHHFFTIDAVDAFMLFWEGKQANRFFLWFDRE